MNNLALLEVYRSLKKLAEDMGVNYIDIGLAPDQGELLITVYQGHARSTVSIARGDLTPENKHVFQQASERLMHNHVTLRSAQEEAKKTGV